MTATLALVFWSTMALKACPYPVLAALGASDWVTVVLFIASMVSGGLSGYAAKQARKIDDLQTAVEQRDERIDAKTHELVEEKVKARFATLDQKLGFMGLQLAAIEKRLERGDGKLDDLTDTDTQIRIQVAMQMEQVRTWIAEHCVAKEDLREMRQQINALVAMGRQA